MAASENSSRAVDANGVHERARVIVTEVSQRFGALMSRQTFVELGLWNAAMEFVSQLVGGRVSPAVARMRATQMLLTKLDHLSIPALDAEKAELERGTAVRDFSLPDCTECGGDQSRTCPACGGNPDGDTLCPRCGGEGLVSCSCLRRVQYALPTTVRPGYVVRGISQGGAEVGAHYATLTCPAEWRPPRPIGLTVVACLGILAGVLAVVLCLIGLVSEPLPLETAFFIGVLALGLATTAASIQSFIGTRWAWHVMRLVVAAVSLLWLLGVLFGFLLWLRMGLDVVSLCVTLAALCLLAISVLLLRYWQSASVQRFFGRPVHGDVREMAALFPLRDRLAFSRHTRPHVWRNAIVIAGLAAVLSPSLGTARGVLVRAQVAEALGGVESAIDLYDRAAARLPKEQRIPIFRASSRLRVQRVADRIKQPDNLILASEDLLRLVDNRSELEAQVREQLPALLGECGDRLLDIQEWDGARNVREALVSDFPRSQEAQLISNSSRWRFQEVLAWETRPKLVSDIRVVQGINYWDSKIEKDYLWGGKEHTLLLLRAQLLHLGGAQAQLPASSISLMDEHGQPIGCVGILSARRGTGAEWEELWQVETFDDEGTAGPDFREVVLVFRVPRSSQDLRIRMAGVTVDRIRLGPVHTLAGHTDKVWSVAFSDDGEILVTGSSDKTARLWSVATGQELAVLNGHTGPVRCVAVSPDGDTVATASDDETVKIWDVDTGKTARTLTGHTAATLAVAFSPSGGTLATASADKTVRLWDMDTGALRKTLTGHRGEVGSVAFSPDGTRIATASADGTVRLWDAESGEFLRALTGHDGEVLSASFSPNGERLVSAGADNTLKIWSAADGTLEKTLRGHTNWAVSAVFSPDGRMLASGSYDKTVKVWAVDDGELQKTFTGHSGGVTMVAFSPDGDLVASASGDNTVKIWDVSELTQQNDKA